MLTYALQVWSFKIVVSLYYGVLQLFSRANRPTLTKSYACRPKLTSRIFIPKSHKAGDRHPLLLDVHGGGFVMGSPAMDDPFCRSMCDKYGLLVVSLQYNLAPRSKFPVAVHDIAVQAAAVIDDESLPIDKTKVAIAGFSAGGNLAAGAVQLEPLKGRVSGLIAIYPVVDFVPTVQEKLANRWVKGFDMLASSAPAFNWALVPKGTDRRDPILSPRWAARETLPPHIYIISCELDMLAHEAMEMAESLAGRTLTKTPLESSWKENQVKWEVVKDQPHGFNFTTKDEKAKVETENMYDRIGVWIQKL
ncbi:alpha/beta hydrolase fold protein [Mycena floridula]|nr:alpha/beta hydrolase fold protein [Mycena floridula]